MTQDRLKLEPQDDIDLWLQGCDIWKKTVWKQLRSAYQFYFLGFPRIVDLVIPKRIWKNVKVSLKSLSFSEKEWNFKIVSTLIGKES